jgi:hypothetical protein
MPTFQRFDTISRYLLILLIALLPFFFIPVAWIGIAQSKVLFIAVLLALATLFWAIARIFEGVVRIPLSFVLGASALLPLAYAVSALVRGWNTLSIVGSGVEQDTLAAICMSIATFALFVLLFSKEFGWVSLTLRAFLCGAAIMMVLQIVHLALPAAPLSAIFAGNSGNALGSWHEFCIMVGFVLIMCLILSEIDIAKEYWNYFFWGCSLVSFMLLVLGGFSDIWIALACVSLLLVIHRTYLYGLKNISAHWQQIAWWTALFCVSVVLAIFGARLQNTLPSSLTVQSVEVRPSWQGTFAVGAKALANPVALVFGAGPNTFTRQWALYKPASVNATQFWNSDFSAGVSSIPTSLITLGILGAAAWIFFLGIFIWTFARVFMRRAFSSPHAQIVRPLALGALFLLAFFALYVPGPALSVLTFAFIGLFVAEISHVDRPQHFTFSILGSEWKEIVGTVVFGAFVLSIFAVCITSARVTLAEALIDKSVAAYANSQDMAYSDALINQALWLYPSDDRAHRAAVELGLLELQQLSRQSDPNNAAMKAQLQSALEGTIQQGLSAISIDSADYQNWLELASLYRQLAGAQVPQALENARTAYERAQSADPTSPLPLYGLAQLDILSNDSAAALKDLSAAVQLKPDFAPAYYLASQVYALQNDLKDAAASATLTVQYAPDDPLSWYNLGAILYTQGTYADAATSEEKALALNSRYANALYVEGLAYDALNRPADALKAFEMLDALDPGQSAVQAIISNINKGLPALEKATASH